MYNWEQLPLCTEVSLPFYTKKYKRYFWCTTGPASRWIHTCFPNSVSWTAPSSLHAHAHARTHTQFTGQSTKVFMALLICLKQIEMEGNEEIPIIKYNTPNLLKCLWRCPGFISHKGLVLGFWPNHKKMPRDLYCQPHMQTLEHLWGKPALNRPFLHKQSEKTLNRCEVKLNGPKATGSHFLLRYHFENRESAKKILKQPISSRIQLFSNSSKCVV